MEESAGVLSAIANSVGSSEDALRLLISILAAYPISFIHRKYLYGKPAATQHFYFIFTGLALGCFNFGLDMGHLVITIGVSYLLLAVLGGGIVSLSLVFIFTMTYLLVGYWTTATTDYDIKWTMPQCVLTLRLIGLAFNMSDGSEPEEKLSSENKKVAIRDTPSIVEVFSHNLYPASFLIGPQFSLARFRNFVNCKLQNNKGTELPNSVRSGLLRGSLGAAYLAVYLWGSSYVTDDYILSEEFGQTSFWKRFVLLGLWGRVALYKYISCWLFAEGACTVMGLTYNGDDEAGIEKWDGCSNVKITVFESATRMNHYIQSFNINTNHWVAQYIYKRLKFLNNKVLSQLGVLFFLAIWHGFHSGYYATFFFEFIAILAENEFIATLNRLPSVKEALSKKPLSYLVYILLRIYTFTCMGYAMAAFTLLKHPKYLQIYSVFHYSYHILFLAMIFGLPQLRKRVLPRPPKPEDKDK